MTRGRGELTPQDIEIRKIISNNINKLLVQHNKKQTDIHNATGIPKSTLTGYIKSTSTPNQGNIQKISDFFGVKKSDIDPRFSSDLKKQKKNLDINCIYSQLTPPRQQKVYNFAKGELRNQKNEDKNISVLEHRKIEENNVPKGHYVKVVALASAGHGCYAFEKENTYTVWVNSVPPNYDLAFQISGNSMEPIFRHNEVIFVKRVAHLYTGQIGVIEINNEVFVKKVHYENNRLKLNSLNTAVNKKNERLYPDFYADEKDEIYIIGKVVM